jgi:hypothetical protein
MATTDAYTLLQPAMVFTVPDVTSRVLGQQLISAGPDQVLQYWQDPRALQYWGNPTVQVPLNRVGLLAPWVVIRVLGITLGTDQAGNAVKVSIRFWGQSSGVSTVVTRIGYYFVPFQHLATNFRNRIAGTTGVTTAPLTGVGGGILPPARLP